MSAARRAPRGDRGVASVELLGIMPLGLLLALVGLQVGAFLWAATNTNEAARQAARAESLGDDGCAAFWSTLADSLEGTCRSGGGGTDLGSPPAQVDVSVRVPIIPFIRDFVPTTAIERTVHMP